MERLMSASTSSFVAGGGAVRALRAQAPPGASRRASTLLVQAKKRWETQPTNEKTGKAIAVKMHVKQGDKVKVISGGDKGTVSEILEVRFGHRARAHACALACPRAGCSRRRRDDGSLRRAPVCTLFPRAARRGSVAAAAAQRMRRGRVCSTRRSR